MTKEDFLLLLEANRVVTSTLDLETLLKTVMDLAKKVVKAEAASLLLLDDKTNELVFDVALGEKGEKIKQIRLKLGEGIAGWVAKEGKPLVVADVSQDKRWFKQADQLSEFKTKSILCVPLKYKNKIVGVVEAINRTDHESFLEEDIPLFESFANQVAVAIENARLFSQVREEKEKISAVFTGMGDGAIVTDANGTVLITNSAAERYLGEKIKVGQDIFYCCSEFEFIPQVTVLAEVKNKYFTWELVRKKGKSLYLNVNGTKILDATKKKEVIGYIFVVRDVTSERKEERLKRNFLSLISHKLRTPLTSIIGYTTLMEDTELGPMQKKGITTIGHQSRYLSSLVDKLLNFTLLESEAMELNRGSCVLKDLVSESVEELSLLIKDAGADVIQEPVLEKMPLLAVDKIKTKEVIKNLVENAIKFNRSKDIAKEKKVLVHISAREIAKQFVEIKIEDNGIGIPPEEQEKVFQRFYQIEESFTGQIEGAGLGLPLVKRIVESHQGRVWLESVIGQGSIFYFTLPVAE